MEKTCLLSILFLATISCSTDGAKHNAEFQFSRDIGKFPSEAFKRIPDVVCSRKNGNYGCLRVNTQYDCRIWYDVNAESGKISGWRYVSRPENCWIYGGA